MVKLSVNSFNLTDLPSMTKSVPNLKLTLGTKYESYYYLTELLNHVRDEGRERGKTPNQVMAISKARGAVLQRSLSSSG